MKSAKELFEEINRMNLQFMYQGEYKYKLSKYLEEFYYKLIKEYMLAKFDESKKYRSDETAELLDIAARLVVPKSENPSATKKEAGWVNEYDKSGFAKKISDFIKFARKQPEVFNTISEIVENTIEKPLQRQISDKDKELNENKKEIDDLKQTVSETDGKLSEQNKKMKILEANNKTMKKVLDKGVVGQVADKAKEIAQTVLDPVHTAQKAKLLDGLTNLKTKLEELGNIPVNTNDLFDYLVRFANIVAEFQDKNYKFSPQLLEATPQEANKLEEHTRLVGHGRLAPNKPGAIATKDNIQVGFMIKGDERPTAKPLSYIMSHYGKNQDIKDQVKESIIKLLKENRKPMIDLITKILAANKKPDNTIVKMVNAFGKENN